jgi:hypothetical protein
MINTRWNRKSKIQNRKWLGLSVIAFVLVVAGPVVQAQQAKKIPRIGFLSASGPNRIMRHFVKGCVNWATLKDRTSSSSGDLQKGTSIGFPSTQSSWFV